MSNSTIIHNYLWNKALCISKTLNTTKRNTKLWRFLHNFVFNLFSLLRPLDLWSTKKFSLAHHANESFQAGWKPLRCKNLFLLLYCRGFIASPKLLLLPPILRIFNERMNDLESISLVIHQVSIKMAWLCWFQGLTGDEKEALNKTWIKNDVRDRIVWRKRRGWTMARKNSCCSSSFIELAVNCT